MAREVEPDAGEGHAGYAGQEGYVGHAGPISPRGLEPSPQLEPRTLLGASYLSANFSTESLEPEPKTERRHLIVSPTLQQLYAQRTRRPHSMYVETPIYEHAELQNSINYTPPFLPPPERKPRLRLTSPKRPGLPGRQTSPLRQSPKPFNFKPQEMGNGVGKPAHRKGHRYKHSSVSMNLFQEPKAAPVEVPDLHPIPSFEESLASVTPGQKLKLVLSIGHFLSAGIVFAAGVWIHEPAFSTLSHLVFYDSLGSLTVTLVDVMSNFQVWKSALLVYPFGLGRVEVLAGFALSTSLVMVGCDLVSHFVEELVVLAVSPDAQHGLHHIHGGAVTSWVAHTLVLLFVIGVTSITSSLVFDDGTIAEMMKPQQNLEISSDRSWTRVYRRAQQVISKNPMRLVTVGYCLYLLLAPLFEESGDVSTLVVAAFLCSSGWGYVKTLGGILLMLFPDSDHDYNRLRAQLTDKIMGLDSFKTGCSLTDLYVVKVNYELYVVGLKLVMRGTSDDQLRLVYDVDRCVRREMARYDGKVETTIDVER